MDAKKFLKNSILSFGSSIKSNNLILHVVFYCDDKMFEFNPYTKQIRPFNSIFWYTIDGDAFYDILNYFSNKYVEMLELQYEERDNKSNDLGYGTLCDSTFAVEMGKFREFIIDRDDRQDIIKEFDKFVTYLKDVYDRWESVHSFLIENYKEFDKLFK